MPGIHGLIVTSGQCRGALVAVRAEVLSLRAKSLMTAPARRIGTYGLRCKGTLDTLSPPFSRRQRPLRPGGLAMMTTVGHMLSAKADIHAVKPEDTVYDALALMAARNIGAVLVVSGSDLKGIFSERDYARKVVLH